MPKRGASAKGGKARKSSKLNVKKKMLKDLGPKDDVVGGMDLVSNVRSFSYAVDIGRAPGAPAPKKQFSQPL